MHRSLIRRVTSRERSLRDIFLRLNSFEKEVVALKAFRAAVEIASPHVAEAAQQLAEEKLKSLDKTTVDLENPLTPEEFEELYQFHALQQSRPISMTRLLHINNQTDLLSHAKEVHYELAVRTAYIAHLLNMSPLGLARMPSIQRLRKWYEWTYHDVQSVAVPTNEEGLLEFHQLSNRIFSQHREVRPLLFRGLEELRSRETWTAEMMASRTPEFDELQEAFERFCRARVRLRFLVVNYSALTRSFFPKFRDDQATITNYDSEFSKEARRYGIEQEEISAYDHNPEDFRGLICRATSLVKVVQHAIAEVRENFAADEVPPIELKVAGDPEMTFLGIPRNLVEIVASLVEASVQANLLRLDRTGTPLSPIEITISQHPNNHDLSVKVSDTAGGIPLAEVDRSMTYVYCSRSATKRDIQLPYTAVAAKALGGEITVASIEGYGTDRTLHVPNTETVKTLTF